jgi:tRNA threonylcarbamoyladenosine biosynthesis protein TsaE
VRDAHPALSRVSFTVRTGDPEATESLGASLGEVLEAGDLVVLTGDLGAGKTTLARGLARGLGVAAPVKSPTFALRLDYPGRVPVHHLDLYRIERCAELDELGLEDCFGAEGVALVEWGERLGAAAPPGAVRIVIEEDGDTGRIFTVAGPEPAVRRLAASAGVDPRRVAALPPGEEP